MNNREKAFNNRDYWLELVENEAQIWKDGFLKKPLSKESIFLYTVIIDYNKGFIRNRWAHYPDLISLMGFIEHVFMPTTAFTMLDDEEEHFNVPLASTEDVLYYMEDKVNKKNVYRDINLSVEKFQCIKEKRIPQEEKFRELQLFCKEFSKLWYEREQKVVYIQIFNRANGISDFVDNLSQQFGTDIIEEELGMTYSQWKHMCDNVYESEFLTHKFTSILNNKLSCLV